MPHPDVLILRALRGAPLACLLAIRYLGRAGTSDLDAATGYDHETVARGLRALASLGLITQAARYRGWQLTQMAVQLPLFTPAELSGTGDERERGNSAVERGFSALPRLGGGGGLTELIPQEEELTLTTTTVSERGNSAVERGFSALPDAETADVDRLAELLVTRLTCRRRRAVEAVQAALLRGDAPAYVERQIIIWDNWLAVEANRRGLKYPGLYVAAKLQDAEPAPDGVTIAWTDTARCEALRRALTGDVVEPVSPADPDAPLPILPAWPSPPIPDHTWEAARSYLRLQLPRSTFETWVRDTVCLAHDDERLVIGVANAYVQEWLSLRLRPLIQRILAGIVGHAVEVAFVAPQTEEA